MRTPQPTDRIRNVEQLEQWLSEPHERLIQTMTRVPGDIVVLGVAGKMGPTLARMARRAADEADTPRRVIGVSRFSNAAEREKLDAWGIETIKADLLDERAVADLPDAPNVVFMAGMKFGATGNESLTWAMNTHLPAAVCKRYADSRIVAFSTGNVYGLRPLASGGSLESDTPNPMGEYAMSCLGRERIFEHFSRSLKIPTAIIRLNYACELRYGVLVDLAKKVWSDQPIDLTMGVFNVICQTDANAMSLCALEHCSSPPDMLNIAGPETLSIRRVCKDFGQLMHKEIRFTGEEMTDALFSNGQLAHERYGYPRVGVRQLMREVANWVMQDGELLGKPTKFEVRDGRF